MQANTDNFKLNFMCLNRIYRIFEEVRADKTKKTKYIIGHTYSKRLKYVFAYDGIYLVAPLTSVSTNRLYAFSIDPKIREVYDILEKLPIIYDTNDTELSINTNGVNIGNLNTNTIRGTITGITLRQISANRETMVDYIQNDKNVRVLDAQVNHLWASESKNMKHLTNNLCHSLDLITTHVSPSLNCMYTHELNTEYNDVFAILGIQRAKISTPHVKLDAIGQSVLTTDINHAKMVASRYKRFNYKRIAQYVFNQANLDKTLLIVLSYYTYRGLTETFLLNLTDGLHLFITVHALTPDEYCVKLDFRRFGYYPIGNKKLQTVKYFVLSRNKANVLNDVKKLGDFIRNLIPII